MRKFKIIYKDQETTGLKKLVVNHDEIKHIDSQIENSKRSDFVFLSAKLRVKVSDIQKIEEIPLYNDPVQWENRGEKDNRPILDRLVSWLGKKEIDPLPKALYLLDTYGEQVVARAGQIITEKKAYHVGFKELEIVCEKLKEKFTVNEKNYTSDWLTHEINCLEYKSGICGMRDPRITQYKSMLEKGETFLFNENNIQLF